MESGDQAIDLFLRRLMVRSNLTPGEQNAIRSLTGTTVEYRAHRDFVLPGQKVGHVSLVAGGLAGRFDLMRDGARAIAEFFMPGDVCDLSSLIASRAGWGLTALSTLQVIQIPHQSLREVIRTHPELGTAFWRDSTADAGVVAKWVGNLGRKDARARVAHLFCEMALRAEAAGLGTRTRYNLDITQDQIADAMGLTPVHVNRTLAALREEGAATFRSRIVEVIDWERLTSIAEFDEIFLLLDQPEHTRLFGA